MKIHIPELVLGFVCALVLVHLLPTIPAIISVLLLKILRSLPVNNTDEEILEKATQADEKIEEKHIERNKNIV